jgi:GH18 family chitinase
MKIYGLSWRRYENLYLKNGIANIQLDNLTFAFIIIDNFHIEIRINEHQLLFERKKCV